MRLLKGNGHVVGFMGDGINDAPALRAADIGISVDSAVDIAKEAADIILLEKSLMVLEEGVLEGRRTFANMLKYIKMTASSNFGNVFSVLVASALPAVPADAADAPAGAEPAVRHLADRHSVRQRRRGAAEASRSAGSRAISAASWCFSARSARSSTSPPSS